MECEGIFFFFLVKRVAVADVIVESLLTALLKIEEVAWNTAASFSPAEFI